LEILEVVRRWFGGKEHYRTKRNEIIYIVMRGKKEMRIA